MSLTPPGPPLPPVPGSPQGQVPDGQPRKARTLQAIVVGLIIVGLVAAGAGATMLALKSGDDASESAPASSLTPSPSQTGAMPRTDPALSSFYDQDLDWDKCGKNQCTTLSVPLDYARPEGPTIGIAVLKHPARKSAERLGALVVNPGGPGGSGVQFAAAGASQFGSELTTYFDIVGFDPRGVAGSQPLKCLSTAKLDELMAFDPDPDTAAEVATMDRLYAGFGQGCLEESGDLVRHMSTKEAARDMDVLRAALGQQKLDYLGSSYGTFLGATYADLFPENVGRFVLDGAIDPSLSSAELGRQQAAGFEIALRAYVKDCVEDGDCFLGDTVDAGVGKIQKLLDQLDQRPLPGADGRQLTEGLGMMGVYMPLYSRDFWFLLTKALQDAFRGDGAALLQLADFQTSRGKDGYDGNLIEALNAVNCLDHDDAVSSSEVGPLITQYEKSSPTFGRAFAYAATACSLWPVRSGQQTVALQAKGAPPIVVIGTTRDPATPLIWAEAMAKQLDSGRLITRDGDGHTGFQRGSECTDDAVESWLVEGKVPARDLMCS